MTKIRVSNTDHVPRIITLLLQNAGKAMTLTSGNIHTHIKHFATYYLTFMAAKIHTAIFWVMEECSAVTTDVGGKYRLHCYGTKEPKVEKWQILGKDTRGLSQPRARKCP
jgi:hypothetical protein